MQASYLTPDVVEQRRILRAALRLQPGEDVLDIGSGPGLLASEMASEVAPAGSIHGIDPSKAMIAIAERRDRPQGSVPVSFAIGDANRLPFEDGSFDAAVSTQVYEYVDDIAGALGEAHRVLRPGGRLLILDTDWDSIVWHSGDKVRMQRVLAAWDEPSSTPTYRAAGTPARGRRLLGHRAERDPAPEHRVYPTLHAHLIGFVKAFVPGRGNLTEADLTAWSRTSKRSGTITSSASTAICSRA